MKVCKGQGQYHHHETTKRVEDLLPEFNLVALCALCVGIQMPDVLEQVDRAHAFGFEQRGRHHLGTDLVWPSKTVTSVRSMRALSVLRVTNSVRCTRNSFHDSSDSKLALSARTID